MTAIIECTGIAVGTIAVVIALSVAAGLWLGRHLS